MPDVNLVSSSHYASVLVVAMDGEPLKTSKKVLVQVGTTAWPTGWQEKEATWKSGNKDLKGYEVVSTGKNPWQIVNTDLSVTIRNAGLKKATVLNANGEAVGTVPVSSVKGDGILILRLPANAMYVVLQ